jgi:hypothetical protein
VGGGEEEAEVSIEVDSKPFDGVGSCVHRVNRITPC